MKKKQTLAARVAQSTAMLDTAIEQFESVSLHLQSVAEDHDAIAAEAQAEVERMIALRDEALEQAARADRIAGRVAALVA